MNHNKKHREHFLSTVTTNLESLGYAKESGVAWIRRLQDPKIYHMFELIPRHERMIVRASWNVASTWWDVDWYIIVTTSPPLTSLSIENEFATNNSVQKCIEVYLPELLGELARFETCAEALEGELWNKMAEWSSDLTGMALDAELSEICEDSSRLAARLREILDDEGLVDSPMFTDEKTEWLREKLRMVEARA